MEPLSMGFLLAWQAAGTAMQLFDYNQRKKLSRVGRDLEHEGVLANIELAKTQTAQESVESMQTLRQNLGSQMAVQAARGTASNVGSAFFISQKSIGEFNKDERTRRLNLLAREAELRAGDVLSGLHQLDTETQMGQSVTKSIMDSLPISQLTSFDKTKRVKSTTNKTASSAASRAASRASFKSFGLAPAEF